MVRSVPAFILFCGGGGRVHWVQVVQAFEASGPAGMLALVLRCVFPAFCPPCRFACGAMYLKYALFRILRRFLAGFGVLVWVCSFWVLCVACVAFVRVNS